MVGGRVVLAQIDPNGKPKVSEHSMNTKTKFALAVALNRSIEVGASFTQNDGRSVLRFQATMIAGQNLNLNGSDDVIAACGPDDDVFDYHIHRGHDTLTWRPAALTPSLPLPVIVTEKPTTAATNKPTAAPTQKPTAAPTQAPTQTPTQVPTTQKPTAQPSSGPSLPPSERTGDYVVGTANSAACAPGSVALASADACANASKLLDLVYAGSKDDPALPSGCFKQARPHAPL
jgi:hypothetical protein